MITVATAKIHATILVEFAEEFANGRLYNLGIYNRRYIAGTTIWSQHAWGNADDIGVKVGHRGAGAVGDQLASFLRQHRTTGTLPVGTVLWRIRNHYDHLHIEGAPKQTGTPPLPDSEEEIDMEKLKELVTGIQKTLLAAGYTLPRYGADGYWGSETAAAFTAMTKDAARTQTALTDHRHGQASTTGGVVDAG